MIFQNTKINIIYDDWEKPIALLYKNVVLYNYEQQTKQNKIRLAWSENYRNYKNKLQIACIDGNNEIISDKLSHNLKKIRNLMVDLWWPAYNLTPSLTHLFVLFFALWLVVSLPQSLSKFSRKLLEASLTCWLQIELEKLWPEIEKNKTSKLGKNTPYTSFHKMSPN